MKPFDQLAKDLLQTLLAPEHEVHAPREVRHEAQQIDVFTTPSRRSTASVEERAARYGWLARMAATPACFEAYSVPLRLSRVLHARRRQLAVWHELSRERVTNVLPFLWLLAPGASAALQEGFGLDARRDWPSAFRFSPRAERWAIVLLPQLEVSRATLPLRALGRGAVQRAALLEIAALPTDDPLRALLTEVCLRNLTALSLPNHEARMDPENIDVLRELVAQRDRELVEHARNDGRVGGLRDGRVEGRVEGLRAALRAMFAARAVPLTAAQAALVDGCVDVEQLERWVARAAVASDAATVFDPHAH